MSVPEGFDYDTPTNRVRCRACYQIVPVQSRRTTDGWIAYTSLSAHLRSHTHQNSIAQLAAIESVRTPAVPVVAAAPLTRGPVPVPQLHLPSALLSPTAAPPPSVAYDVNGIELMDIDVHSSGTMPPEVTWTPDEEAERERRLIAEHRLRYLRAMAEMDLGAPVLEPETETRAAIDPLEELAEREEVEGDDAELEEFFRTTQNALESGWDPYPSLAMFLLDLLDNLPRLRLSTAQLRIFIHIMKKLGARGVPSLYALRKFQKSMNEKNGVRTGKYTSSLGNVFYANNINDIIAQDYANPHTAPLLVNYPEETDGPKSEMWQFSRWKELPRNLLTPMYVKGGQHFYVDEIAQTMSNEAYVPIMWIRRRSTLHADGRIALFADAHRVTVENGRVRVNEAIQSVEAELFVKTYPEIIAGRIPFLFEDSSRSFSDKMPNPLRALADGLPLYTSFLNVWADDVSGNVSKQYNKHENVCLSHACLPGQVLQQEYHIHFVSTSPHATSLEQLETVQQMILSSQTSPTTTYHASLCHKCKIRNLMVCGPGDNPQQSKECSHIGLNGNLFCRDCKTGGDDKTKESVSGYERLYETQTLHTAEGTLQEIVDQLSSAMTGVQKSVKDKQTSSGVKDAIAQHWIDQLIIEARRLRSGPNRLSIDETVARLKVWLEGQTSQPYNPLFGLPGFDPHRDTPVEILHTVLLGVVKYVWHNFHSEWKTKDLEEFVPRLQATDIGALSSPPIRAAYIAQYKSNLVGKHFKTLMQTLSFHGIHITSETTAHLMQSIGELGALLWVPEITDLDAYLADLEILIDNVLDAFAAVDPLRIPVKPKLHLLKHLIPNIRRFGPAIRFSTEVFESFNAVFRQCSILSNRQAPSRDIAHKFSSMERVKHLVFHGYSFDDHGRLTKPGRRLTEFINQNPIYCQYMGWIKQTPPVIGDYRLAPKSQRAINWSSTHAARLISNAADSLSSLLWQSAQAVTIQSHDECTIGSWVCVRADNGAVHFGRVSELLATPAAIAHPVLITIAQFELADERHPVLKMPRLFRAQAVAFVAIPSQVQFTFNVQHDCHAGKCKVTLASSTVTQEREPVARELPVLQHADDKNFIINSHALHNAHLLRQVVPRHLLAPTHTHADRAAFHAGLAPQIQATQTKKRKDVATKRAAAAAARTAADAEGLADVQGEDALEPRVEERAP